MTDRRARDAYEDLATKEDIANSTSKLIWWIIAAAIPGWIILALFMFQVVATMALFGRFTP